MDLADKLIKGLTLLKPYIARTSLDYIPECYPLTSAPKPPNILYLEVEPNVYEVPENVAIMLKEIGWQCVDDFYWICYEE